MQNPIKFYLVGSNILSSFSPIIHNKLFQVKGKASYVYQLYQENVLPNLDALAEAGDFGGMSITMPFKRSYRDQHSGARNCVLKYTGSFASRTNIINTILKRDRFLCQAFNTDLFGIEKTLAAASDMDSVVILGAGATSHTFCEFFLNNHKCKQIFILNRSRSRVDELSSSYKKVNSISNYKDAKIGLLVNTLPCQIISQNQDEYQLAIKQLNFKEQANFMDVNYRTKHPILETWIQAKCSHLNVFSGLDMLIWQAIQQNRIFCQDDTQTESSQLQHFEILKQLVMGTQPKK